MTITYTNGKDKLILKPNNKANKGKTGFDAVLNGKKIGWYDQSIIPELLKQNLGNYWNEKDLL